MSLQPSDLTPYPACANRLQRNFTRLDEPAMNAYWASVIVADFCHDEALAAFGGFDFSDRSSDNGFRQLSRLEQCIRAGKHRKPKLAVPAEVVAMLGARGVKTSMLLKDADYWEVAGLIFPGCIKPAKSLSKLHEQIKAIPKKERKRLADANLRHVRPEWLSVATAHQGKLQ